MSCIYTAQGKIICKESFADSQCPNNIASTIGSIISKYPTCSYSSDPTKCDYKINCNNSNNICGRIYASLTRDPTAFESCTNNFDMKDPNKCNFSFIGCKL